VLGPRDRASHLAYETAIRTLCGEVVQLRTEDTSAPQCGSCLHVLAKFVEEGLERSHLIERPMCVGITAKGKPCLRDPIYSNKWCSSHYPPARM
jgi:bacterioferritin-associated ferredoxin